ncbi:glycoside hydrolase family 43 protein [Hypoxylon argillaceum]|nr:glycoside hydrolase family 43 protein [Hypoxylon argillaceum]
MHSIAHQWVWPFVALLTTVLAETNSTYTNPILPGFHPDPSCIFVPDWDETFFCASSSFNAIPGIPLHASKDLQNWKLIGHVLDRREQLPRLAETNRSTSGIWAPTIRYDKNSKTFWLVTTLVDDDRPDNDASRWDNIIFKSKNPFNPKSWSKAVHFDFEGYDTSPFWDVDGKTYIIGAHAWRVSPGIMLAEADLDTGKVGEWKTIWEGTGGSAPEGPHVYRKDGWYYLLAAEGGTGLNHMVTMARSESLYGPYEANPANPVLTNANTTEYFQTVGHADLFQDPSNNWWGVALSTRAGPEYLNFPMVRETVMVPVTWEKNHFPIWSPVKGVMSGWAMPKANKEIPGAGPFINEGDAIDFAPGTALPAHFTHWRYPIPESYAVSPPERSHALRLLPSRLNLTALTGNYAGPAGQTFVGRRQQDTLFTFGVDVEFPPGDSHPDFHPHAAVLGAEAGVSAFLTQNHHLDLGVVMLPAASGTGVGPGAGPDTSGSYANVGNASEALIPHFRFRAISYVPVPSDVVVPVPPAWRGSPLRLEIRASNVSHYVFSAGPAGAMSRMKTFLEVSNEPVSWGFTGVLLGVYCTGNGNNGTTPAYFSRWRYTPQGQFRD